MERKGIVSNFEEIGQEREARQRAEAAAPTEGQACLRRIDELVSKYDSLWSSLGGEDGHGAVAVRVVIEKDLDAPGLGREDVGVHIYPQDYDSRHLLGLPPTGFSVTAFFGDRDDSRPVWGEKEEIGHTGLYKAIEYNSYMRQEIFWTPDMVERAQAYLEERESAMKETLDWLLEAACDRRLNPELADRAQAYCDSLLAAA